METDVCKRILLAPVGSEGDVNPFLWLAEGLRARGHEVHLLLSPHYGWLADARALKWTAVGDAEDFLRFARDPKLWNPLRGTERVLEATVAGFEVMRTAYRQTGGDLDLLITSTMGIAFSALAEAEGIPRLILHLQPVCLRSVFENPLYVQELAWLAHMPHGIKRAFFGIVDHVLNKHLLRPINTFRQELGLKTVKNVYWETLMAGDAVGLLFPDWFAEPQPDWPVGIRQFGFPLKLEDSDRPLEVSLQAFLDAGEAPILWSHGSANFQVREFQEIALATSAKLGKRCLLVSLEPPEMPLPPGVFHIDHVAFERVFPRCLAVVNHGGIGTLSKALLAGIPQLVVPMAHDQPDNGARLERLGVGFSIPKRRLNVKRAVEKLTHLLQSPEVAGRCRAVQKTLHEVDPLPEICAWIEQLPRKC